MRASGGSKDEERVYHDMGITALRGVKKMSRPQDKNLRPGEYKLSHEEQKKGGEKSGEARRKKKMLKEYAEQILACVVKDVRLETQFKKFGIKPDSKGKYTFYEAMIIGQIAQAVKGNTQAYNAIKETIEPKNEIGAGNVEDLTPLAELLKINDGENDE